MTTVQQNSVTGRLTFRAKGRAKREEAVVEAAVGRVPRIARLMALAIRMNRMLETGEVSSQKELAELARITPARLTQILNLNHLAPDVQELLLALPATTRGRDQVTERDLRPSAQCLDWSVQLRHWETLRISMKIVEPSSV